MEREWRLEQEAKHTRGSRGWGWGWGQGSEGQCWPALQQRTLGVPPGQVRASQPRRSSLQSSIYQVSIFLPVYW